MSDVLSVSEIDSWLDSLTEERRLAVFKSLSRYLSAAEIKRVIAGLEGGESLLSVHRALGLVKKYYVDIDRVRRLEHSQ